MQAALTPMELSDADAFRIAFWIAFRCACEWSLVLVWGTHQGLTCFNLQVCRCAARRFACVRLRWVDVCIATSQRVEQIPESKSVQVLEEHYKSAYQHISISTLSNI